MNRGILRITSDCAVNPVAIIKDFVCAAKIERAAPDCFGWLQYDYADGTIIFVPKWRTKSLTQRL